MNLTIKSANELLGLPRQNKMTMYVFAFDVDGTLITNDDPKRQNGVVSSNETEHVDIVYLLKILSKCFKNITIVVWSGGGEQYARTIGCRLGIDQYVDKFMSKIDYKLLCDKYNVIAIDDIQDTALGNVANLIVKMK